MGILVFSWSCCLSLYCDLHAGDHFVSFLGDGQSAGVSVQDPQALVDIGDPQIHGRLAARIILRRQKQSDLLPVFLRDPVNEKHAM